MLSAESPQPSYHGLRSVSNKCYTLCLCILILITGCSRPHNQGIKYKKDKPLTYISDQFGNRIPDYSSAGYGGGKPIPSAQTVITLSAQTGNKDDTARLQAAVDELSSGDIDTEGMRGAILLQAGDYYVSGTITIRHGGVVIRGEGQFDNGTVIHATGKTQRSLMIISGMDPEQDAVNQSHGGTFIYQNENASFSEVIDEYLPSGSHIIQVSPVRGFKAGDTVVLEQRMNLDWVKILGMDNFPNRPDGQISTPWNPEDFLFQFERSIEKVEGGRIHLIEPLVNPIFARFGSTRLFKPQLPRRIENVGVENIRFVSDFVPTDNDSDEAHAWNSIEFQRAQNSWVRGVTAVHFGNSTVTTGRESIRITVEDCAFLKPIAGYGYGRRHGFFNAGQQILMQRCFTENCEFPFIIPGKTAGPNVFLDCYASGEKTVIGPWRYWAMGTLWDNVHGEKLIIRNRGFEGNNWGWSGINHLFWNSTAYDSISVQSPINGWNWAIGSKGNITTVPFQGLPGHYSNHDHPTDPRSLYMKQSEDRKGLSQTEHVFSQNQKSGSTLFHLRDTLSER